MFPRISSVLFVAAAGLCTLMHAQAQTVFETQMLGSNEVPPVISASGGTCKAILADDESALGIGCTYAGFTPQAPAGVEGSVHIHNAPMGENGGIVFDLTPALTPVGFGAGDGSRVFDGSIQATLPMTPALVDELRAGNLYVNMHSAAFPSGEIRGQLGVAPTYEPVPFQGLLRGGFEVPPVDTQASGICEGELNATRTAFTLSCEHDLVTAEPGGHIHLGRGGVNGDIVFNLPGLGESPIQASWTVTPALAENRPAINRPLTPELVDELLRNHLYVNLHSAGFPGGELRTTLFRVDVVVIPTLGNLAMLLVAGICAGLGVLTLRRRRPM